MSAQNNNPWKFQQVPFDSRILEKLSGFQPHHLNDEHQRKIWVEYAKKFSQMKLTSDDVESMGYETFTTLRHILSSTLSDLSRTTQIQKGQIEEQEETYKKLAIEEEKLKKIYDENKKKSEEIKMKLVNLKVRAAEQDDSLLNSENFDEDSNNN